MVAIATGIFKTVAFKKQAGLGVKAPAGAAGTAQYMRRVTSQLDLKRTNFKSKEIRPSQQIQDMRLGVRSVAGTITGELTVGGYQSFMESVLRQVSQSVVSSGALTTAAITSTGANSGTITITGANFLTLGFKFGDVVSCSGWTAPATANNVRSFMVVGLSATSMSVITLDQGAVVAKTAGDSVTIAHAGKKTWVPQTGQSRDYYTIEHFHSDIAQSEVFTDCVIGEMDVKIPATAIADVSFPIMGLNMTATQTQYFTSPAAIPTGSALAGVNGVLIVNTSVVATITALDFKVKGGNTHIGGVVGSQVDPDIYIGPLEVDGSVSVLFTDNAMRDLFLAEAEATIVVALSAGNAFTSFVMPRVKFTDAAKNDGNAGITQTMPFIALENINGAPDRLATTISIQDSAFV